MTDYFYQARVRDDPPEDEGEAPFADAARRNPYPPEDEAYWSEAGAAAPEPDEPLWYEDRVHLGDRAPPPEPPPPPEPLPPQPAGRRGWRMLRRERPEPETSAAPATAVAEDANPSWAEQPEPETAEVPAPAEPRPARGWRLFHAKPAEQGPATVAAPVAVEEASPDWTTHTVAETEAEAPPVESSPRRGWSLFRSKRTPNGRADLAAESEAPEPVSTATEEEAAPYWTEAGSPPDREQALWYEDRVRREGGAPPEPPAPPSRREAWREPPPRWSEPEVPAPAAWTGEYPRSYWTEQAEADAGAEPWRDDSAYGEPAYGDEDRVARWEIAPANGEGIGREARAYVPGAAAAAARAAAEAGERNIRFDPTKERGPEYHDHAARHSRRVRVLRIALPTIAVLSVIGFFAVMSFDSNDAGLPSLGLSGINIEQREITMDKPHISGFDGTKRAYEIYAATATQALGNTKIVTLETIQAKFALGDDVRANLEAVSGVYDSNTQKLKLTGGINLATTNGYKAELKEADVDVEAGNVASDTGVVIRGKEGSISADSIEVLDRGKHIFFRGNVKVSYQPPETPENEAAGGTAEASTPTPAPTTIEAATDGST